MSDLAQVSEIELEKVKFEQFTSITCSNKNDIHIQIYRKIWTKRARNRHKYQHKKMKFSQLIKFKFQFYILFDINWINGSARACVVHARARASVTFIIAVIEWQANRCGVARTIPGRVVRPIFSILLHDIYDFISFVIFSTVVTVNLRMRHRSTVVISARYWRIFEK